MSRETEAKVRRWMKRNPLAYSPTRRHRVNGEWIEVDAPLPKHIVRPITVDDVK